MKYQIVVKEEAVGDMTEAFEWYESQRVGLGVEFLNEVELYYDRIAVNPEIYQQLNTERIAVLQRFPYKIVYQVEKQEVIVLALYLASSARTHHTLARARERLTVLNHLAMFNAKVNWIARCNHAERDCKNKVCCPSARYQWSWSTAAFFAVYQR